MAWAKIDDGWWSHPKVMDLSLAASGLWARALSWSCHQRRDTVPRRFLAMVDADEVLAKELVEAGLWHEDEGGWRIHDWAEYQERSLSEKRAEAGAKGGKASGEARRSTRNKATDEAPAKQTRSKTKQTDEANREAGPTRPGPTRPNPPTRARASEPESEAHEPAGEGGPTPSVEYGQDTLGRLPDRVTRKINAESAQAIARLHAALAAAEAGGLSPGEVRRLWDDPTAIDDDSVDSVAACAASRIRKRLDGGEVPA